MDWLWSGPSPFYVVWQLFLVFAGVVLAVHVICFVISLILRIYVNHLYKQRPSQKGDA